MMIAFSGVSREWLERWQYVFVGFFLISALVDIIQYTHTHTRLQRSTISSHKDLQTSPAVQAGPCRWRGIDTTYHPSTQIMKQEGIVYFVCVRKSVASTNARCLDLYLVNPSYGTGPQIPRAASKPHTDTDRQRNTNTMRFPQPWARGD